MEIHKGLNIIWFRKYFA